jgi:hypothetical protein
MIIGDIFATNNINLVAPELLDRWSKVKSSCQFSVASFQTGV